MSFTLQSQLMFSLLYQIYAAQAIDGATNFTINKVFSDITLGKALVQHTYKTIQPVIDDDGCQFHCFLDVDCISYNFDGPQQICNLSDSDHVMHPESLVDTPNAMYRRIQNNCGCTSNSISCEVNFLNGAHVCRCKPGFEGEHCERNTDHCIDNPCQNGGTCINRENGFHCICIKGFDGQHCTIFGIIGGNSRNKSNNACFHKPCRNGGSCHSQVNGSICLCMQGYSGKNCEVVLQPLEMGSSCKEIYDKTGNRESKAYSLAIGNTGRTDIYCHMTDDICGAGGWTLVMKIDGSKATFTYDKPLWTNKKTFSLQDGQTGFDNYESKMPSYWAMPFDKLCVGFKVNDTLKWAVIPYKASSLYDVIQYNRYIPTSLGRDKWLSLIDGARLQPICNREGFNNRLTRIGIKADDFFSCFRCDSFLGLGTKDKKLSCGNVCTYSPCSGTSIAAFGYIMIQ